MPDDLANPDTKLYVVGMEDFDPIEAWEMYKEQGYRKPVAQEGGKLHWDRRSIKNFLVSWLVDYKKARVSFKIYKLCDSSVDLLIHAWESMGIKDDIRKK